MPGIFGFVDKMGQYVIEETANNMSNIMRHGDSHVEKHISDSCILGTIDLKLENTKNKIATNNDSSLVCVSRGTINNKKNLSEKFRLEQAPYENDAQFFIDLYRKKSSEFPRYINGLFTTAIYDGKKDRVIIANDRYGFYPLFYSVNNNRFVFASEVKAILCDTEFAAKINETAVAEFFVFSYLLGNKTFFEGIETMKPANMLICDKTKNQIRSEQYWDFTTPKNKVESLSSLLEEFRTLMRKSVKQTVRDKKKVGVFLSGGLDSRLIAAFTSETTAEIMTFTFGTRNCWDEKIAKQVAEKLGVENLFYEIPSDFIADYAEKIVYLGDGLIRIRDCHFIALLDEIKRKVDIVLLGTFGGELFGSKITRQLKNLKKRDDVMAYLYRKNATMIPIERLQEFFTDAFHEKIKGKVWKNFIDTFNGIEFNSTEDIIDYWEYRNRQRRYIFQSFQYMNWYLETHHPFLDNDVVDFFAFRLPFHLRLNEKFLQKALNYCFPSLSEIPWEHSGAPPDAQQLNVFVSKAMRFAKHNVRKTAERLSKRRIVLAPSDYRGYDEWLRTGSKAYITKTLLAPQTLQRGFIRPTYIKRILKEHMSYKKNHDQLICDIINFELLNRMFLD